MAITSNTLLVFRCSRELAVRHVVTSCRAVALFLLADAGLSFDHIRLLTSCVFKWVRK